jgi:hypothetical protein
MLARPARDAVVCVVKDSVNGFEPCMRGEGGKVVGKKIESRRKQATERVFARAGIE